MNMRGKLCFCNSVQTCMMAHVNKIGFLSSYPMRVFNGLLDTLMGRMIIYMQSIHNEHIQTFQGIVRLLWSSYR